MEIIDVTDRIDPGDMIVSRALIDSGGPGDTITTRDKRVWEIYVDGAGINQLRERR